MLMPPAPNPRRASRPDRNPKRSERNVSSRPRAARRDHSTTDPGSRRRPTRQGQGADAVDRESPGRASKGGERARSKYPESGRSNRTPARSSSPRERSSGPRQGRTPRGSASSTRSGGSRRAERSDFRPPIRQRPTSTERARTSRGPGERRSEGRRDGRGLGRAKSPFPPRGSDGEPRQRRSPAPADGRRGPRGTSKSESSDRRGSINPKWGGVARRGAAHMRSEATRERSTRRMGTTRFTTEDTGNEKFAAPPKSRYRISGSGFDQKRSPRSESTRSAGGRSRPPRNRAKQASKSVHSELASSLPPRSLTSVESRLASAVRAYERDRYREALATLRGLVRIAPDTPAVRELLGLTLYRLGDWKGALRELRRFGELSGSVDQLPVLADCERALGHHDRVIELWSELRRAGPPSEVLVEGRLVAAGSLADQGKLKEAIALIGPSASRSLRKPQPQHVRQWYLLGDLYERTGDVPRARQMFERVAAVDPETADVGERLAQLGRPAVPRPSNRGARIGSTSRGKTLRRSGQGG